MKRVVLLAVLLIAACASTYTGPLSVRILQAGMFGPGEVGRRGRNLYTTAKIVRETDTIPAEVGAGFGIRFLAERPTGGIVPLRVRFTHPPIDGREVDESTANYSSGTPVVIGSYFAKTTDLQAGTWTIELFSGDRLMASHSFQVIHATLLH
jgi:hypothetical protein